MPRPKTRWIGISKHNKATILRLADDNRLNGLLETSIENHTTYMVKLAKYLKSKRFEDATADELKEFFKNINYNSLSQRILKINIKRFYKWLYGLEKDDPYPDVVRWIKFKSKRQLLKEKDVDAIKNKTISAEEYQILLNGAQGNIQLQAIIETLHLSGCRIKELTSMNVCDVEDDNGIVIITVRDSKTIPRKIPLSSYPEYLMRWIDETPFKNQRNKPLWLNFNNDHRVYMLRLSTHWIREEIHHIQKEKGLKRIIPHMFRHTAITKDLDNNMPNTHVCSKYGWVKGSEMLPIYDHNEFDALKKWVSKGKSQTQPTYDIIRRQKERLEHDFEQRLQSMEQKFEEKMKIMDSGLSRATRRNVPGYPSQKIIEDYQRLKKGLEMMLNRMTVEGRSQAEIEEFRKMITSGLA